MTPNRRTTWTVGTLTLAVLVGVVVAAWRPVMERWYAWRLGNDSLSLETREEAATRLLEMRSPLLMETAFASLDRLGEHPLKWDFPTYELELVCDFVHEQRDEQRSECVELCLPAVRRAMRDGGRAKRYWAAKLLGQFWMDALPAGEEMFGGLQSTDARYRAACLDALASCLMEWAGTPTFPGRMSIDELARHMGAEPTLIRQGLAVIIPSRLGGPTDHLSRAFILERVVLPSDLQRQLVQFVGEDPALGFPACYDAAAAADCAILLDEIERGYRRGDHGYVERLLDVIDGMHPTESICVEQLVMMAVDFEVRDLVIATLWTAVAFSEDRSRNEALLLTVLSNGSPVARRAALEFIYAHDRAIEVARLEHGLLLGAADLDPETRRCLSAILRPTGADEVNVDECLCGRGSADHVD